MASWFQFAYLISCVGMALALLDSCLGFASLVWASCLVPSDCHSPHLNLSICQLCVTEMCSFKKTSFWCVLDNEETLLEYLVEIFPLTCNHWILVHLKVWPVPLPGVSCVPLLPCLVQESRCSSCKFPTLVQLLSHCGKNSFFINLMSHLPGNIKYLPIWLSSGHWNVNESPMCCFQAWKSLACAFNSSHSFPPTLAWSRPLKAHVEDGRATDKKNLGSWIIAWKRANFQKGKSI